MPTFLLFEKGTKTGEIVGANVGALDKLIVASAEKYPSVQSEQEEKTKADE
jgi:hypothetical protein